MGRRLRVRIEQLRHSLFFVPALYVGSAILAAEGMRWVDSELVRRGADLPFVIEVSAESARALLGTIAGATITVAGVVFAITLVSIQLASSQFSPRVIPGFLRDAHQQQVLGLVVGTFTYCLIVLAAVRNSVDVPYLSVALALVLAVLSILGLVAYLDHRARSLQVGEIIRSVAEQTRGRIRHLYPHAAGEAPPSPMHRQPLPSEPGHLVRARRSGWVRHLDLEALLRAIPAEGLARLDVRNGTFVAHRQVIAMTWPAPADLETLDRAFNDALVLGGSRMMLQDVAFGIRQLVDIALRALSPGVNDPTTAYEALMHLGNVMRELLWRDLSPVVRVKDGRRLVSGADLSHDDYVSRAFDQIRESARTQAAVIATFLLVTGGIAADLERDGLASRAPSLRRQGRLALAGYEAEGPLEPDRDRMRALAHRVGLDETGDAKNG